MLGISPFCLCRNTYGNQRVVGWNFGMELGIFNKFGGFRGLNCSRQQNTYVSDGNKKIKS
jgi:hypothetical protein